MVWCAGGRECGDIGETVLNSGQTDRLFCANESQCK